MAKKNKVINSIDEFYKIYLPDYDKNKEILSSIEDPNERNEIEIELVSKSIREEMEKIWA